MTDSRRVPGYPMRYMAAKKVDEALMENVHYYDVKGNGERTLPVREAKPEDAKRIGRRKPSSLV